MTAHVNKQLALLCKYPRHSTSCAVHQQFNTQAAVSSKMYWCAGRQFVQATSKQRPPLGASPRPAPLSGAAKPPSVPNTPPIGAGPLPATALLASSQVQGRAVLNHPLQVTPPAMSLQPASHSLCTVCNLLSPHSDCGCQCCCQMDCKYPDRDPC